MSRILVIEDEAPLRVILARLLALEGFDVVTADGGARGLDLARTLRPDLILCDVALPELDGYGVLDALQADPATARLPLVYLTGSADRSEREAGLARGAREYLTKPFDIREVLAVVRRHLAAPGC